MSPGRPKLPADQKRTALQPREECPCGCGYVQPSELGWQREERLRRAGVSPAFRVRVFKGMPSARLRRIGSMQEGKARRAGLKWDTVNLATLHRHYGGNCGICGEPVSQDEMDVDHIHPVCAGGGYLWENLQPAHKSCNSRKGRKVA